MMRGMTVLWATLALAVGVGLFLLKYEVQSLEDRLAAVNGDIRRNQETIHILKAEWSYLNDPERLRDLNERHLGMKTFGTDQIVSVADLPFAAPPTTEPQPEEAPGGRIMVDSPAPAPTPVAQPRKPAEIREARRSEPAKPAVPAPAPQIAKSPKPAPPPVVVAQPVAPRPAPVLPALPVRAPAALSAPTGGDVLVIKSPALLDAERRMGR